MPRSGAEARARLERAALELYIERGYDHTTAADIAACAGVSARTFFRHFADKREVLFNVETGMEDAITQALSAVPEDLPPIAAVLEALRSVAPVLEENRDLARARHRLALRERELAKAASLGAAIATGLRARGVEEWGATLVGRVSTAAWAHAIHAWTNDPSADYDALLVRAFAELSDFSGGLPHEGSPVRRPAR